MQTQIRLLPFLEQSDEGLHCLTTHQHIMGVLLYCKIKLYHFTTIMVFILCVPIFKIQTIILSFCCFFHDRICRDFLFMCFLLVYIDGHKLDYVSGPPGKVAVFLLGIIWKATEL